MSLIPKVSPVLPTSTAPLLGPLRATLAAPPEVTDAAEVVLAGPGPLTYGRAGESTAAEQQQTFRRVVAGALEEQAVLGWSPSATADRIVHVADEILGQDPTRGPEVEAWLTEGVERARKATGVTEAGTLAIDLTFRRLHEIFSRLNEPYSD